MTSEAKRLLERLALEEFDEVYGQYRDGEATLEDVSLRRRALRMASMVDDNESA